MSAEMWRWPDFVVKDTFTVKSAQVACLLSLALGENNDDGHRVRPDRAKPLKSGSRAGKDESAEYAVSAGGAPRFVRRKLRRKALHLDRAAIERGLEEIASKYPRVFADFLSGKEDRGTANIFLRCCLDRE